MSRPLANDAGFFYVIQLDPLNDPAAIKVGWSINVELRVSQHRRVRHRPRAVVLKAWPARFSWESLIIGHLRQCGFRRLRGEEYVSDNPYALTRAVDCFLEGWEPVPSPCPKPRVRVEVMDTGEEPMIDTQQLSDALGIPKMTLWRRAKAGVIPSHWEYRHALDKKPKLRFKLSEVQAAIKASQTGD